MLDTSVERTRCCTYTLLPNGVHRLRFSNASPEAVDELFMVLGKMFYGKTQRDPRIRILLDTSVSGLPSLGRLMNGARGMALRFPNRPEIQIALIIHRNFRAVIPTLEAFISLFRSTNRVRSFDVEDETAALAWLTEDMKRGAK